MKQNLRFFYTLLAAFLINAPLISLAQQPEQDCINAIPVCQNVYSQFNSYTGEGTDPNEISATLSCLASGEENDVWYIFTVQTSGLLNFTISPLNFFDDYDWAVYNLTGNSCSDIGTNPALEVSCNYSATTGTTGPNAPGYPSSQSAIGNPFNSPIPVTAGETYVVNVSNFTGSATGYSLDFSASTAVIFDNIPPKMDTVFAECNGTINVRFSENVVCSSVDAGDFTLSGPGGPYSITSISGSNCLNGGAFEDVYQITVSPALSNSGTYYLSLVDIVLDNCGNVGLFGTDSLSIYFPLINPSASPDTLCQGSTTTLSVNPLPGLSYTWSGGPTGPTVNVTPPNSANYTCFATDANGCLFTGSVYVHVWPSPTSTFTATPSQNCSDQPVSFNFTGTGNPNANFNWDFTGGQVLSGSGAGPLTVKWSNPGSYNVNLTVTQNGCSSTVSTVPVTIHPIPTADFSAPSAVCIGSPALLMYTGNASAAANFSWDFDGGIPVSGTGAGPYQIEWNTQGPKTISLTVEENGCVSVAQSFAVEVNPSPAVSLNSVNNQCLKGNQFDFTFNSPASATAYSWDFGDNSPISTQASPSYSYSTPGPYTVSLTLTDLNGCASTVSTSFEIYPPVTADFTFSPVCFGVSTPFTDQSLFDSNGPIQNWQWDFANMGNSADQHPAFSFTQFGTHSVQLITATIHGCKDTVVKNIEVYDQPVASFDVYAACDGLPLSFVNTSTHHNPQVSYLWNFGNGTSTNKDPSHLFSGPGAHQVSMTVTTDQGCSDTFTNQAEVYYLPVADFEIPTYCLNEKVFVSNLSNVGGGAKLNQFKWNFGAGIQTVTTPNPLVPYKNAGVYPVKLWVSTNNGCADSISKTVTVKPVPSAAFDVKSVCESETATFSNYSSIDVINNDSLVAWVWDFGDQTGSDLKEPQHLFPKEGNYEILLTAISSNGCESSKRQSLEIYPEPDAPTIYPDTTCFSERAFLITEPDPFTSWVEWYFNSSEKKAFHKGFSYITPPLPYGQTYFVEAVNEFGCRSERIPIEAHVYKTVSGSIAVSDSVLHIPDATVTSSLPGSFKVRNYSWDFGDGHSSLESQPIHQYQRPGKYIIKLVVTTAEGCNFTANKLVEVKELIVVHIPSAFSPNGDGINDEFYLASQLIEQIDFRVFNRWGQLVFQSSQPDFRWNGRKANGGWAEEGVYTYILKGIDIHGKIFHQAGTLTLFK